MPYFPQLTTDLDNIQALDDLPNQTGGLTAAELKAKFDKAGDDIKDYINTVLLPALESTIASSSGASGIGIEAIVGLTGAANVQDALAAILALYTAGTVADGSVTTVKLADDAVTAAKIDGGAVGTPALAAGAVTPAKTDFTGADLTIGANGKKLTINGPIILSANSYGNSLPGTATTGQLFFKKV